MTTGLDRARQKMADAGATDAAIDVFTHYYGQLDAEGGGFIREDDIDKAKAAIADAGLDITDPPEGWLFKAWHEGQLVDVIFRALLPALPDRLPAGTKAMMCHAGFGGVDPETGVIALPDSGASLHCEAIPAHLLEIVRLGGLLPYLEQYLARRGTTSPPSTA